MISACPNCKKPLRFTDAHKDKLTAALARLKQGQTLKFGCPICKVPIELAADGLPPGKREVPLQQTAKESAPAKPAAVEKSAKPKNSDKKPPRPPEPPDIQYITSGEIQDKNIVENIPTAMVIVADKAMEDSIAACLKQEEYQIYVPETVDEAIKSMRFKNYEVVVYHSRYEELPLNIQDLHKFMKFMTMTKRRYIYYILIGPEFQTIYDLQALANSANLVINENEVPFFSTLFKIGRMDYEELFNPYITMLKKFGKS